MAKTEYLRIRIKLHIKRRCAHVYRSKSQNYDADNVSFATPQGAAPPWPATTASTRFQAKCESRHWTRNNCSDIAFFQSCGLWPCEQLLFSPEKALSGCQLETRNGIHVQVLVRDNNVDQALRALKKKMQREGIFREMKMRDYYEKPSQKRAREKAEAVRRVRKLARKRAQRESGIVAPTRTASASAR
jgi:ribosomal protein S21